MFSSIHLILGLALKIGFINSDGDASDTWVMIASTGNLTFSAGSFTTTDDEILTLADVYPPAESAWIHLSITCNKLSARCYLFRDGSFVGESVESLDSSWFFSTNIFFGKCIY